MSIILRADFKDEVFLQIADVLGQLSTCDRASIGAVIVRDGRCVSWGFNGAPPGMPHCSENHHGWLGQPTIEETNKDGVLIDPIPKYGCRNATHAEANALTFAARQGISTDDGTLYVSQSPCVECARLLVAAGIARVLWRVEYRDPAGLNLLAEAGVELL
jgi:dCMP deaminase